MIGHPISRSWALYSDGIFNDPFCHILQIGGHATIATGFNTEAEIPYYRFKNSWGGDWGDKGYIKMALVDGNGSCLINIAAKGYAPWFE